jgi:hypothetical protein
MAVTPAAVEAGEVVGLEASTAPAATSRSTTAGC